MFKINYIIVGYANKDIMPTKFDFFESNYIYGGNNVGKTAMLFSIDFVLGKSNFNLQDKEGLDNIEYIETKITENSDTLYLRRTIENICSYKHSETDEYIDTSEALYKDEITYLINKGDSKYLEIFDEFADENLTSRAFSFFNFVDEKGLGNLTNIFTRAKDYQHQTRVRKIMMFIFNYDNVRKISELGRREKDISKYLSDHAHEKSNYNYFIGLIHKGILQLHIDSSFLVEDIKNSFFEYKKNFTRESKRESKSSGDIGYLIKIQHALSEEIKYQRSLEKQVDKLTSRNTRAKGLLTAFKEIAQEDAFYGIYVDKINALIQKQINNNDVLSVKDVGKTIAAIEKRKIKIDLEIEACLSGLDKNEYEDTIKTIGVLEQAFIEIEKFAEIKIIEEKEKELKQIKEDIKKLNNIFSDILKNKFNNLVLKYYKELDGQICFATEDFQKTRFEIDFNPLKCSLFGKKAKDDSPNSEMCIYSPGSMARETTWQILAYLAMFEVLMESFPALPFMRVLFIDGINQPFDESLDSYPNVFKFIQKKSSEIGIQLFVISTLEGLPIGAKNQIDLKNGFNRAHKN